jgi:hypothetical protein
MAYVYKVLPMAIRTPEDKKLQEELKARANEGKQYNAIFGGWFSGNVASAHSYNPNSKQSSPLPESEVSEGPIYRALNLLNRK